MAPLIFFFDNILVNPMLNILVWLYTIVFDNFGLSLILFTVIVRLLTTPLTLKQTKQMRAMTGLQPRMKEIQTRYANDPRKRSQEMMNVYREAGVNPLGCLGPMVIQLPIWIGLYQALLKSLGTNPDDLVGLSQRLYSWNPVADTAVPLNSVFFGMDLANPDPTPILPLLVGLSTWAQQKMTTMPTADPRQQSTNNMMLWMMPLMLAFFAFTFPSGLALYWVISAAIGVAMQGFITKDWSPIIPSFIKPKPAPEPASPAPEEREAEPKELESDGTARVEGNVRKNRRRGHRSGPERARRRPNRGRNRNTKPR
ncbi:MAG: membrane protein insertase YidC [Dehalococcoidia bacterium]|nr:membrane protein insertase YidC [Dehalococcoidia bacterium]